MAVERLETRVEGARGNLLGLAFRTSLLTVITLGLYRFWMKTRLRRWVWSALRPGGHPLEYTGNPAEKLAGFLTAVMILALYLGLFNLVLVFLSYAVLAQHVAGYALSFLGLVPLYFFAQYRARRYLLARTRWRGVRFGVEPGAWTYARHAALHWAITVVTLGALWPRMTFLLEKFRTDRTWFGTARFRQDGRWQMLLPAMRHVYIGLGIIVLGVLAGAVSEPGWYALAIPGTLWFLAGIVHYRVHAFRLLTAGKALDPQPDGPSPGVRFRAAPRTGRILRIYVFGGMAMGLAMLACLFVFLLALGIALGAIEDTMPEGLPDPGTRGAIVAAVASYFLFFISWGVLGQVFIAFPVLRHMVESLEIDGAHRLAEIAQRARDPAADAEGFADALDVGAAL